MGKVKEWMGLYMWANDSRTKEIQRTLDSQKANVNTMTASKLPNPSIASSKKEGQTN